MMAKWGHIEGQGLGNDSSGIVEPLTVQRAKAAKAAQGKAAAAGGIGVKEGAKTAKIINKNENDSERLKYGDPSTIVVLTNMVGLDDAYDEELRDEIGDECGKYGVVVRVVVHVVNPIPVDHDQAVRIFVQFSGPAGAWKTVRELDGRFFGGKTVHARYFPEALFAQQALDGPLP
ncbi:hypothetical protein DL93DRAFT_2083117 [Clavulina sp. PMI_390]|nr:hypothetical protein DL93DRAFT_2083117 [Clavulina sp. PMI_390]